MPFVVEICFLEVVDHLAGETFPEVDQGDVLVDQGNYAVVFDVFLELNQLEGFLEELESFLFAVRGLQQQSDVVVGYPTLFFPEFGGFQETSQGFGILLQELEIVGCVEIDVGEFKGLAAVDFLDMAYQYLKHIERVPDEFMHEAGQGGDEAQFA